MDLRYLAAHWDDVRAGLVQALDKVGDGELDFRPYPGAWSVRQLVLHIAQEERGERDYGIRRTPDAFPAEYASGAFPTVAYLTALLASVHVATTEYLATLDDGDLGQTVATPWGASYRLIEMLGHLVEHEIHHRGELSLILGMLGREGLDA